MAGLVDISEALLLAGLSDTVTDEERAIVLMCMTAAEGAVRRHLKYDPAYAQRTEYYPLLDQNMGSRESIYEVSSTQAYQRFVTDASSTMLQLKHLPIRSVTSLRIDYDGRSGTRSGAFGSETAKTEGVDFWANYDGVDSDGNKVCRDGILRSVGLWPNNTGSVKVVYYSGYRSKELRGQDSIIDASPIWDCCLDETTRRLQKVMSRKKNGLAGFSGPLQSEKLGDYAYTANANLLSRLIGGGDLMPESVEKLNDFLNYGFMMCP